MIGLRLYIPRQISISLSIRVLLGSFVINFSGLGLELGSDSLLIFSSTEFTDFGLFSGIESSIKGLGLCGITGIAIRSGDFSIFDFESGTDFILLISGVSGEGVYCVKSEYPK